jgi:hypothetical protein
MVCFSASVNVRLGAAADSAVGSMGSRKFDTHPVSKLEARIIAKFRLLISYLDPMMPVWSEQASEDGSAPIVARQFNGKPLRARGLASSLISHWNALGQT